MSITFAQPDPIGIMQSAAADKVKFDQANLQRDYNLKVQQAQQSAYQDNQRTALAQSAQAQSAYQFDAQQGQQMQLAQQHGVLQQQLQDQAGNQQIQALNQAEQLRMAGLQKQMSYLQQQKDNGAYDDQSFQAAQAQLMGVLSPLQARQQAAALQHQQQQNQQQLEEAARMAVIRGTDRNAAGQMVERGLINRGGIDYQTDQHGMLMPLEKPADEAAYAAAHGGASRQNIQDAVIDQYRNALPGLGELTDEGVRQFVHPDELRRAISAEEEKRAAGGSIAQQEAMLQHGLREAQHHRQEMQKEETAARALTADPSLIKDWMKTPAAREAEYQRRVTDSLAFVRQTLGLRGQAPSGQPGAAPATPASDTLPPLARAHFPTGPQGDVAYGAAMASRARAAATPTASARPGGETEANALEAVRGRVSEHHNAQPWYERLGTGGANFGSGSTRDVREMHDILHRAVGANADLTPAERMRYQQLHQGIADRGDVPSEKLATMKLPGSQPAAWGDKDRVAALKSIADRYVASNRTLGVRGGAGSNEVMAMRDILDKAQQAGRGLMPWEVSTYNALLLQLDRQRERGAGRIHDQLQLQ